jgi:hypothetical protein
MLRIRDVNPHPNFSIPDPGSEFFPSRILDPLKRIQVFEPKKIVSKLLEILFGLFIADPDPDFLTILDPGSRGHKGTRSRIRIRNTEITSISH